MSALWDPNLEPNSPEDRDAAEIARLLGRFAHSKTELDGLDGSDRLDTQSAEDEQSLRHPQRGRRTGFRVAAGVAAIAACVAIVWAIAMRESEVVSTNALRWGERNLAQGDKVTATNDLKDLRVGKGGLVQLTPGCRVQVKLQSAFRVELMVLPPSDSKSKFKVRVSANRGDPGLLQVMTKQASCASMNAGEALDYTLLLSGAGKTATTQVFVTKGALKVQADDAKFIVPAHAAMFANVKHGGSPPWFVSDDGMLGSVVEMFVQEQDPKHRVELAQKLGYYAERPRDSLTLWHLLFDRDPKVVVVAQALLGDLARLPTGVNLTREEWFERLQKLWW